MMRILMLGGSLCLVAGMLSGGPAFAVEPPSGPLDVDEAVRIALRQNFSYKQAETSLASAYADRLDALANLLPGASGNYSHSQRSTTNILDNQPSRIRIDNNEVIETRDFDLTSKSTSNGWSVSFSENLSLPLWYRYQSARAGVDAARHGKAASAQDLAYQVRSQYYLALRAEALLEVQQLDFDLSQSEERRTNAMFELGSVAKADVLKAKVRVADAEVGLIRQRNQVEIEHSRLATLLGFTPNSRLQLNGDLEISAVAVDSLGAARDALVRPDLMQARANLDAANSGWKASLWSRLPRLFANFSTNDNTGTNEGEDLDGSVSADGQFITVTPRRFEGDSNTDGWSFQVGASIDLDIFLNTGQDRRARAQKWSAEFALQDLQLAAQQELEESILNVRASQSAIESAQRGVEAAEEDLRLSRERYEQGLGTILELLQAQVDLTRARYTLVNAQTELKISEAALNKAQGSELPG